MATTNNEAPDILHLLTGEGPDPETSEIEESSLGTPKAGTVTENTDDTAVQQKIPEQTGIEQDIPNISIISTGNSEDDPVADLIKEQLEEDFPEDILRPQHSHTDIPEFPEDLDPSMPTHEGTADGTADAEKDTDIFPEDIEIKMDTNGSTDGSSGAGEQIIGESPDGPLAEDAADGSDDPDPIPHPADGDHLQTYRFVNVMEYIVKDLVMEYMVRFNMCTCERCMVDTMALALTACPAKYIVVDSHSVSPLLNFYSNRYQGNVSVELTKACIKIKDNPRH